MKMVPASRQPSDDRLIHEHPTVEGFIKRRLGDGSHTTDHKVVWNYYAPRKRWEAVCEMLDVVFYAEAVSIPQDILFRKGRTLA